MAEPTDNSITLLTGSANPGLANEIASYLSLPLGNVKLGRFADGEVHVLIEESVRGKDVYVIQSLSRPVNDHVMELLVMIDALKREDEVRIPNFGVFAVVAAFARFTPLATFAADTPPTVLTTVAP